MSPWKTSHWLIALTLLAGASAILFFQYADPNSSSFFWPRCTFHEATGWHCPGCGSTRALHALAHGDLLGAIAKNVVIVLLLPIGLIYSARMVWNASVPQRLALLAGFRLPAWSILTLGCALLLFGVLRNIPGFEVLAPH